MFGQHEQDSGGWGLTRQVLGMVLHVGETV